MKTIDRLIAEHDIIERGLNLLGKAVVLIDSGQTIPEGFAEWAPVFFAQFADQCHHAKEEDLLFPFLKERGIPEQGGPIGVMLHEHDVGRDCVRQMKDATTTDFDSNKFADGARKLIPLLREHIFKENNILFRMAENVMSEFEDAELDLRFTQVEEERDLTGLQKQYQTEVAEWEEKLN